MDDMKDLVSIVIPIYNIEDVIIHSLDAVIDQTYKNIELILVDDGSTDHSINVAKDYLALRRMDYQVLVQPNRGPSAARNNGIRSAKGEWVLCLDGDDYILPHTISTMVQTAKDQDVKCVFCDYKSVDEPSIKICAKKNDGIKMISDDVMRGLFFNRKLVPISPGMLLHRSVYEVIQYDEDCRYCEDTLFLWELFYHIDRFVFIYSDLYNYFRREGSTMHSLTPIKYLSSSPRHRFSSEKIQRTFPYDKIAKMIYPKFRLAGLRIICRNNSYRDFIQTVKMDGGNAYIPCLFKQYNPILFLYAFVFYISKRLFYLISK